MPRSPFFRSRLHATLGLAISSLVWYRFGGVVFTGVLACTGACAVLAWAAPQFYQRIQRVFDFVTRLVSTGVTWATLGVVYFGLFLPLRIWRTMTGHDPLSLRPDPGAATYLVRFDPERRSHFDRQF